MGLIMRHAKKSLHKLSVDSIADEKVMPLLLAAKHSGWRQYPSYCQVAAEYAGAQHHYLKISDGDTVIGLANVRIKKIPFLPLGFAIISHGPTLFSAKVEDYERVCLALRKYLVDAKGLSLKINLAPNFSYNEQYELFNGFIPIEGSAYQTFVLDVRKDLEDLRKALNGKWRTDLNRGQKGSVQILSSTKAEDFLKFEPILTQLAADKGFRPPQDAGFFAKVVQSAEQGEHYAIHLAYQDARLIGGHIGAYSGDTAVYLLGATSEEGRKLRASFLLQWEAIKYAKNMGQTYYDLGGVDEETNPDVHRFKKRMGGFYHESASMMMAHPNWFKAKIINVVEKLYQKVRR